MRDYYRAELKKHPSGKSGAGAEDVSNSTWPLFKCLSYLRNTMQTKLVPKTLYRTSTRQKKQT